VEPYFGVTSDSSEMAHEQEVVLLKKVMLLASLVAIMVVALALPALASERWGNDNSHYWDNNSRWDNSNWWDNNNWWHNNDNTAPVVTQESGQEAQSGDVNQSFDVSNTGDNSNQCAGIQGVANTGNAQNQTSVVQYGSEADDFSIDDSGSTIEVSPENTTTCDQQVNQAASAFGS
jgi:hypothetical protein